MQYRGEFATSKMPRIPIVCVIALTVHFTFIIFLALIPLNQSLTFLIGLISLVDVYVHHYGYKDVTLREPIKLVDVLVFDSSQDLFISTV